jgi:hypothetical protein
MINILGGIFGYHQVGREQVKNKEPVGDLAEQMAKLHRAALVRGARRTVVITAVQLILFGGAVLAAFDSPLGKHWYVGWPMMALMVITVASWSYRERCRMPFSPLLPGPASRDEEPGHAVERLQHHLDARSKRLNPGDLRDHAWWATHGLFLTSVPGLGMQVSHSTGSFTYGVAAAWLYTFAMIGLGWWQSRLLVLTLRQWLFASSTDSRDSPE